jgi:transcription-repair coupling factor (superfamily II helicase)
MTNRDSPDDDPLKGALGGIPNLPPGESCVFSSLYGASKAYLIANSFLENPRTILVVLPTLEEAEDFLGDLRFFLKAGSVELFPPTERIAFEASFTHPELMASRLEVLFRLANLESFIVVTTVGTLLERIIPKEALKETSFNLKKGEEYPRDALLEDMFSAGYTRVGMVEERGEMSVRGSVIDIFPPVYKNPLRIEFFDDEIESIREFDSSTQRSTESIDELLILPAREILMGSDQRSEARAQIAQRADEHNLERGVWEPLSNALRDGIIVPGLAPLLPYFYDGLDSLFDYLHETTLVVLSEEAALASELDEIDRSVERVEKRLIEEGCFFVERKSLFLDSSEVKWSLEKFPIIKVQASGGADGLEIGALQNPPVLASIEVKTSETPLKPIAELIRALTSEGTRAYVTAHNKGQAARTCELFEGYELDAQIIEGTSLIYDKSREELKGEGLTVAVGSLSSGFMLNSSAVTIISEEEIFGRRIKHRPPPARKLESFLAELRDLSEGDGIVHTLHGIAIYRGLKRIEVQGVENEFLILEYRDADKLYLPVYRMDQVTKYHAAGKEDGSFTPDKLGGPGWGKRTKRVKKAVERIAAELLKLYAEREASIGFAFSPPDHLFGEFSDGFEYEETPDQMRSIIEVIKDMERSRPMDRLLCGDVGYGKTEVAMRAAFKCVLDNKQAAILVPTTVLAQQHGITFTERFAPYPVKVAVLSRFKSKKEQDEVVEALARGEVDILIGTHRLLGADVSFKDLGLVIVDEEHRFGVKHKERLRNIKKEVDVLTLTATPIPRTLQMSIADIRGLSIISTPPEDRLAVKTVVTGFDEGLIKDAIEREVRRGGQVFFVHNRVESIGAIAELLARIVPEVRVAVAHGQMRERELEKKMLDFMDHNSDVLLCTTIIESGLDIARANTIIINRADRFGLADLYQLRGRVGRSSHRAYAYLLCPPGRMTEDARKRLDAIASLTEPGSGFRVASHDLEIRGAGELLGAKQSGHITEVGFDMYTRLLEEAVSELKGEPIIHEPPPDVNLRVSAYIPEEYIPDTRQRLGIYKRLASLLTDEELESLSDELQDRYGDIPELTGHLVEMTRVRLALTELGAVELKQIAHRLYVRFKPADGEGAQGSGVSKAIIEKALALVESDPARFKVTADNRFVYTMETVDGEVIDPMGEARYILKELLC